MIASCRGVQYAGFEKSIKRFGSALTISSIILPASPIWFGLGRFPNASVAVRLANFFRAVAVRYAVRPKLILPVLSQKHVLSMQAKRVAVPPAGWD